MTRLEQSLPALNAAVALSLLTYLTCFILALSSSTSDLMQFVLDWPTGLIRLSQWLGFALGLAAFAQVLSLSIIWTKLRENANWPISRRLHYTAFTLATAVFVLLLNHWNMIGFRY